MSDRFTPQFLADAACSVFWVLMDLAWMSEWRLAGILLIAPTALAGLSLYRYSDRDFTGLMATTAICGWIGMNTCWMMQDFGPWAHGVHVAYGFFGLAVVCIAAALLHARDRGEALQRLAARLKRFRLPRRDSP